jgi:acetylornithine/succinyldiaminopimelate/putrescine aminotransferase
MMQCLTYAPVLGHITTFGGNPVSCAAGHAALEVLLKEDWMKEVKKKEQILVDQLVHPAIMHRNYMGLWMSLQFDSSELTKKIAATCIQNGIITDWFLFAEDRIRIAPPLCITNKELLEAIQVIQKSISQALQD